MMSIDLKEDIAKIEDVRTRTVIEELVDELDELKTEIAKLEKAQE